MCSKSYVTGARCLDNIKHFFNVAGPGRLLTVATCLQRECDQESKRVLSEFSKHRRLDSIKQQVDEYSRLYSRPVEKLDPKELDLLLGELTIMHSRSELYVRFIKRRVMVTCIHIQLSHV